MPPRKTPIYTCDMPRCHEPAIGLGLCSYHYNRWLYLKRKVKERNYSITYRRIYNRLNKSTDFKIKQELEKRLRGLPEFKDTHKEIKRLEYYMNPLYAYRSGKVSPKKGLRQRKRKPPYQKKGRKPKQICIQCGEDGRYAVAHGLCQRCYERKRKEDNDIDICHVPGCKEPATRLWLCRSHYNRWRRVRYQVETRRYNAELSTWVNNFENKKLPLWKRQWYDKKIEERIKWGGHESDDFLKIQQEFKKLDACTDPEWGEKHKKKHKKPPKWTGYTQYGSYTARLRKT